MKWKNWPWTRGKSWTAFDSCQQSHQQKPWTYPGAYPGTETGWKRVNRRRRVSTSTSWTGYRVARISCSFDARGSPSTCCWCNMERPDPTPIRPWRYRTSLPCRWSLYLLHWRNAGLLILLMSFCGWIEMNMMSYPLTVDSWGGLRWSGLARWIAIWLCFLCFYLVQAAPWISKLCFRDGKKWRLVVKRLE